MREFIVTCDLGVKLVLTCYKYLNCFYFFFSFFPTFHHIVMTVDDVDSIRFFPRDLFGDAEWLSQSNRAFVKTQIDL